MKTYDTCPWIHDLVAKRYTNLTSRKVSAIANMIPVIISKWQLAIAICDSYGVGPVLPEEILELLPDLEAHVGEGLPGVTNDFRQIERAGSLCFAVWLHCLNIYWYCVVVNYSEFNSLVPNP